MAPNQTREPAMPLAPTSRWQSEVPGTRWFRADLHIHTLDDPPRKPPNGLDGERNDPDFLDAYARHVLDAAIDQGIEVLGLTPHCAYVELGFSAALTVRDVWLTGARVDGTSYRDLIFAVYPGFEPNFQDGMQGLHLLFLFDPEIDKDRYMASFSAIMGGRAPYDKHKLQRTTLRPREAFAALDDPKALCRDGYVVIAAHPTQRNGIFHRPSDDIPDLVEDRILALELSRNKTAEEDCANRNLRAAYKRGRALLHNSDANDLPKIGAAPQDRELGHRFTLLKLAAPTISALRQALLARDARTRLPFARLPDGELGVRTDLPEPCPLGRPWLREAHVQGGTSFHRDQVFRFSPDLTCIIGGSMTGKSTLLDGLRLCIEGEKGLPDPRSSLGAAVLARARDGLLSGGAQVALVSPAGDPTIPVDRRTPMRFFSQGELKSLSDDEDSVENLLFHLIPGRATSLIAQREELIHLDERLAQLIPRIIDLGEEAGDAEEELQRTQRARTAIARFDEVGAKDLPRIQQDRARTVAFRDDVQRHLTAAEELHEALEGLAAPPLHDAALIALAGDEPSVADLARAARMGAHHALTSLVALGKRADALTQEASETLRARTEEIQAALVAAGGSAEELNTFGANARAAQHFDRYKDVRDRRLAELDEARAAFAQLLARRDAAIADHRAAMRAICEEIARRFEDRVLVEVKEEGRKQGLQDWFLGQKNAGLSRWWNNAGGEQATATALREIAQAVGDRRHGEALQASQGLGLSDRVSNSLIEVLSTAQSRLEAQAMRCPDRYELKWVEDGDAKRLDELSGGRKVAVLLSLVLESDDPTPLVIDQPEDELDNRFLNETIIPALHRLKGKRQVIFATHNANIVVNGDADQVIVLEATARQGRIAEMGAIENRPVRDAILRTLDGGEDAFRLRRAKYGF